MAVISRGKPNEVQIPSKKWNGEETSPEGSKVWTGPMLKSDIQVPIVYYLSRNGQIEQPHFMEVPLSSSEGLYLRDVLYRLDLLRGKGMASLYSWSSKRSYKNGFVWHDLSENDFVHATPGKEYVLKGSELLDPSPCNKLCGTASSRTMRPPEMHNSGDESDFSEITHGRNRSWSSIDLNEYKVYKAESNSESTGKAAADVATQTEEKKRRRTVRSGKEKVEEGGMEKKSQDEMSHSQSTELSRGEISNPPSDSSPETVESIIKADKRLIFSQNGAKEDCLNRTVQNSPSGRMKASSVLMQLISCGSISFKNCGPTSVRDQEGFQLIGQNKSRLLRVAENQTVEESGRSIQISKFSGSRLEDKAYFSGSLVETKKAEAPPSLMRSSSYNVDRGSQLKLDEKELDGWKTKCIPRKQKSHQTKKEAAIDDIHS